MRKTGLVPLKCAFLFTAATIMLGGNLHSASKKKKKAAAAPVTTVAESTDSNISSDSVKLPSGKGRRTYFSKVSLSVINQICNGSPDSIRSAISELRQKGSEYDESEKVLINIAAQILNTVWPSEKVNWELPEVTADNPYIGALESVKQGLFDSSTGNTDFLSTLLPAIVILNASADSSVYNSCETALKLAMEEYPDSVLANYLLAVLYEKEGRYQESENFYAVAYRGSSTTEEICLPYARILRLNGNLAQASEILASINGTSNDIEILKQNAYIAFDSGDFDSAELYVARVLQQNPNNLEFLLFRAKILIEKKDFIHAVSLLDMYARQDSYSIDYLILRAKVQLDWSKNTTAATETVEKALQSYPDNLDALMFAARISSETDSPVAGKYADELAAKVLEKRPGNQEAMVYALDGLMQRENWQQAYSVSKTLIAGEKVSAQVVEKYVNVCIKLGKNNEAYEYAKSCLDANPQDEVLLQSYILAYSQVGSRDAVLKYIDSLMNSSPAKIKSYLFYRRSYLQLTEEKQLADLRSSLISNPRNSDALFRLYEVYYDKKDYKKAQYYLRQVVAINPNDSSVKKLNEALTKLMQ